TAAHADLHLAPLPGTDGHLAMGVAHLLLRDGRHDESWLNDHALGWPEFRARLAAYTPEAVAARSGLSVYPVGGAPRLYGSRKPGRIGIADGINRNRNGGQNVRAVCALPALTGQYGVRGGGLAYSTGGRVAWDREAVHHRAECPPPGRIVNMNRLGAALL